MYNSKEQIAFLYIDRRVVRLLVTITCFTLASHFAWAQDLDRTVPPILINTDDKMTRRVPDDSLYLFERDFQRRITSVDGPMEVIVFATSGAREWPFARSKKDAIDELLSFLNFGDRGEFEIVTAYGEKTRRRKATIAEIDSILAFVSDNSVDNLPCLEADRIVDGQIKRVLGGTAHVYLHLTKKSGRRVYIHGGHLDPGDEGTKRHSTVVRHFQNLLQQEIQRE